MELVQEALVRLSAGQARNPLRRGLVLEDGRVLGSMPGWLPQPEALGAKLVCVVPANHGGQWDAHQGVVVLFDPSTGVPRAILCASEVTALRTAAASGVATRALAREEAGDLALLGSGIEARAHLAAMKAARPLWRVRVFSPDREHREAFARRESERHGLAVEAVASPREAVRGADLVCTVTSAREPVLRGDWISPGAHLNAVGACRPAARELDGEAVRRARTFTDSAESARAEAGDLLAAEREGAIAAGHDVTELGAVLAGRAPGRRDESEITLFESLGVAVEDVIVAHDVWQRAREEGLGTAVELGGRRDA